MYGLEAINQANGWAMAVAGGIIVMIGLALLSTIISLIPKAVSLMERRGDMKEEEMTAAAEAGAEEPAVAPAPRFLDVVELTETYRPLAAELGSTFPLTDLFRICNEKEVPHAHLSIRTLIEAGKLAPEGDGIFSFKA